MSINKEPNTNSRYEQEEKKRKEYFALLFELPKFSKKQRQDDYRLMALYADETFIPELLNQLQKETDDDLCNSISQTLAAIGQSVINDILKVLSETTIEDKYKKYLFVILTVLDVTEHIDDLLTLSLKESFYPVVEQCLLELGVLGIPKLIAQLSHPDIDMREKVKQILVQFKQEDLNFVLSSYDVLPEEDALRDLFGASFINALPNGSQEAPPVF